MPAANTTTKYSSVIRYNSNLQTISVTHKKTSYQIIIDIMGLCLIYCIVNVLFGIFHLGGTHASVLGGLRASLPFMVK